MLVLVLKVLNGYSKRFTADHYQGGCALLFAGELKVEIDEANERLRQDYQERQGINRNYLVDALSPTTKRRMEEVVKKDILPL